MLRILVTLFAALLGLAFGSFLNVCISRWPHNESIVHPRSHCRSCGRTLAWWENIPVVSWITLRGRCRTCGIRISGRYPLIETAVGLLWGLLAWYSSADVLAFDIPLRQRTLNLSGLLCGFAFLWLLTALAALDAEHLWLPDFLTYPGIVAGVAVKVLFEQFGSHAGQPERPWYALLLSVTGAAAAAALVLFVRWLYWILRRREGLGMGDAKLLALLAAWLGLPLALLALFLGVVLGASIAVAWLLLRRNRQNPWAAAKLPLGTFLCIGGVISALWGQQILNVYLRWSGL